jgi:hypothetical protein
MGIVAVGVELMNKKREEREMELVSVIYLS